MSTKNTFPVHENISRFYDRVGDEYRHWSPSLNIHFGYFGRGVNPFRLESMLDRMSLEVLDRLQLTENSTVLDLGCGTGAVSRLMAREMPGARFHGVTISPWQVDLGEKMNLASGLDDRITLHLEDFQAMPFPENFAEAAFAVESACYADGLSKSRLIEEAGRVLEPGGRFVVVDGFRKHGKPLPVWLEKLYRRYLSLWSLAELPALPAFTKALKAHGFSISTVKDISWQVAPTAFHIPPTILKVMLNRWSQPAQRISKEQKNYLKGLALTMVMGLWKQHFGYYLVTCLKN